MDDKMIGRCQDQLREINKLMFHSEDKNAKRAIYLLTDVLQNILINGLEEHDE
jgi:hypothetical protein